MNKLILVLLGMLMVPGLAQSQTVGGPTREGKPVLAPGPAPVLVGGKAETSCSSVDDGDARGICLTTDGSVRISGTVTATSGSTAAAATVAAEATAKTADFTLVAATANLRLIHWSCRESAATAALATVVLRHDTVATTCDGPVFAYVELGANQSTGDHYGPRGLAAASGICGDVLAGTVDCSVSTVVEAAP